MRYLSLSALYGSALPAGLSTTRDTASTAGLSTKRDTASTAVRSLPDLAPYVWRQHARTALYVSVALYGCSLCEGEGIEDERRPCLCCSLWLLSMAGMLSLSLSLPHCLSQ